MTLQFDAALQNNCEGHFRQFCFTRADPLVARLGFVTNRGSDTVSVLDLNNNVVIDAIDVGNAPSGAALDAAGRRLYVANSLDNAVSVLRVGSSDSDGDQHDHE